MYNWIISYKKDHKKRVKLGVCNEPIIPPKPTQLLGRFLRVGELGWVINFFTMGRVGFESWDLQICLTRLDLPIFNIFLKFKNILTIGGSDWVRRICKYYDPNPTQLIGWMGLMSFFNLTQPNPLGSGWVKLDPWIGFFF